MKDFLHNYIQKYSLSSLFVNLFNKKLKFTKKIRAINTAYLLFWNLLLLILLFLNIKSIYLLLASIYRLVDLSLVLLQIAIFPKEIQYRLRAFLMIFIHYFQYIIIFSVLYMNVDNNFLATNNMGLNAFNAIFFSISSITSMGTNNIDINVYSKSLIMLESIIGILFIAVFLYNAMYVFYGFKEKKAQIQILNQLRRIRKKLSNIEGKVL